MSKGLGRRQLLVPRYGAVGWLVDGPNPGFLHGAKPDMVTTAQEARDFVRRVNATGIDFIKVTDTCRERVFCYCR